MIHVYVNSILILKVHLKETVKGHSLQSYSSLQVFYIFLISESKRPFKFIYNSVTVTIIYLCLKKGLHAWLHENKYRTFQEYFAFYSLNFYFQSFSTLNQNITVYKHSLSVPYKYLVSNYISITFCIYIKMYLYSLVHCI